MQDSLDAPLDTIADGNYYFTTFYNSRVTPAQHYHTVLPSLPLILPPSSRSGPHSSYVIAMNHTRAKFMERTALPTTCTVTIILKSWNVSSHSSSPTKKYQARDSPEQW